MSFMMPKPKAPPPPPNAASSPIQAGGGLNDFPNAASMNSLITTGPQGLRRKATTERTSLIGGY